MTILTALNFMLLTLYMRNRIRQERLIGTGIAGMLIGIFGVGCASCGSVLLSSFIGVSSTIAFLDVFPLNGLEFALLGIALLLFSSWTLVKKLQGKDACALPIKQ